MMSAMFCGVLLCSFPIQKLFTPLADTVIAAVANHPCPVAAIAH